VQPPRDSMSARRLRMVCMVVALGLSTIGCGRVESMWNGGDQPLDRSAVILDFAADPRAALLKYKPQWDAQTAIGKVPTAGAVALAGELMRADPASYDQYYRYALAQSGSEDTDVASAAMGALSRAKGLESIDVLIAKAGDPRAEVASSALIAIDYRYVTSMYESGSSSDHTHLKQALPTICRGEFAAFVRTCKK